MEDIHDLFMRFFTVVYIFSVDTRGERTFAYSKIQAAWADSYWITPSGNQLHEEKCVRQMRSGKKARDRDVQSDLLLSRLDGVGAVADVATNSESKVATDGA